MQHITSNDAAKLQIGQAQYSALTTPEGTFVDDLLVYRFAEEHFLLVVNAANIDKDFAWIAEHAPEAGEVAVVNSSPTATPSSPSRVRRPRRSLQRLTGVDLAAINYYWFAHGEVAGVRATVSRTGYTGEDGFEIFVPPQSPPQLWDALLEAGKPDGLVPAGLGARDTLRLEAAMRLYGNDIDETTTVLEADLGWIVGWNKTEFLGRDVLRAQKAEGVTQKLVGFEMLDRAIARHGHAVLHDGAAVGVVTSGTQTPFLKKAIGMAYVPPALADAGHRVRPSTSAAGCARGRRRPDAVLQAPKA